MTLRQQISFIKEKVRVYKNDIEFSPYMTRVEYCKRKLPYYEAILKSLESLL